MKKRNGHKAETLQAEQPVELIKLDHQTVKQLFEQFEEAEENGEKQQIVQTAIRELKIHKAIEEDLFYPAVRSELEGDEEGEELMDEALEEHHVADVLIQELEDMEPEDERYCAKFMVLAESVRHHIKEEESEMLPKAKKTEANNEELGARMQQRKDELQAEFGGEPPRLTAREESSRKKSRR